MRLIIVAASAGDVCPFDSAPLFDALQHLLEPSNPAEKLRCQANPFAEFRYQMFVAESQTLSHAPNCSHLGRQVELIQGKPHDSRVFESLAYLAEQEFFEQAEFLRRVGRFQQRVAQMPCGASPYRFELDNCVLELNDG